MVKRIVKGNLLHFPVSSMNPESTFEYIKDGALYLEGKRIVAIGSERDISAQYPDAEITDYSGKLILPGLIDSHVHMPQTEMIASYGEQLLDWLNKYTFPTERKFEDPEYAAAITNVFLQQLWQNGTTTALTYSTVHPSTTDILFELASEQDMAMFTGKVCMDRHAPEWLQDSPESALNDSAALIEKWHNKGRNRYVITPRFAPTSTKKQLSALGELQASFKDVYLQTHLSENTSEVEWVKSLFPESAHYLDVYDQYGLVHEKAFFGHCIYLDEPAWEMMSERNAKVSFCPRSNTFLGSGLYPLAKADDLGVATTLASDVAGGDSFNLLRTCGEAYKVCQLQGYQLHPLRSLYMVTQGTADALGLASEIGNLNPDSFADFVVLDPHFSELSQLRIQNLHDIEDVVFALSMLADERSTVATWIAGKPVYHKN